MQKEIEKITYSYGGFNTYAKARFTDGTYSGKVDVSGMSREQEVKALIGSNPDRDDVKSFISSVLV